MSNPEQRREAKIGTPPGIREWRLRPEIDFYLRGLARRLRKPLEMRHIRVHPANIAEEIVWKLKAYERDLPGPREELAAHELMDSHAAPSTIAAGRRELANLIAVLARPLADVTNAYDLDLSLKIGKQLAAPVADADGPGIYASVETGNTAESGVHAVMRRRFAFHKDDALCPAPPQIEIGMTIVCRPGKVGISQTHDDGTRRKAARLMGGDNALYQWTANTLQAVTGHIEAHKEQIQNAAEKESLKQAQDALAQFMLIMREEFDLASIETARVTAMQSVELPGANETTNLPYEATLPPGAIPYIDAVDRALEGVKNISSALGVALEHFHEMIAVAFAPSGVTVDGVAHNQPSPPSATQAPANTHEKKFVDNNRNGINDEDEEPEEEPSGLLALAADAMLANRERRREPVLPSANRAHEPAAAEPPQPQDS